MSEFLGELARTVAKPMPRSRALRLLGGALVVVDDKKNIARVDCCTSGQRCRQGVCV